MQVSLQAITQGAMRGVPLSSDEKPDLRSAVQSVLDLQGTRQQIVEAYQAGLKDPKEDLLVVGGKLYNTKTKQFIAVQDAAEMLPLSALGDVATADSVIEYAQTGDAAKLVAKQPESDTGSELKNPVEEELIKRTREGESAVREFNNANLLQQQLLDGSIELTPGFIGGLRTRAYEIAGIQDEEEAVKKDFIRRRNTQIINSLPPGIASDTDIRVFSAGFPSDNANQETVLRFLAAQKRIFSAAADMGFLYDQHITQQMTDGVKSPTTAGFYSKKMAYGNAIAILETNIQRDPSKAQKYLGDFQKAFGFVPLFYR